MKAFNLNTIQVGPQCTLIYFIKIAKYRFLEETDNCERTCFFHVNSLLPNKYLATSGENVRASRYLIVTLSLGQSTSPFAPTNNEMRKNRGRIKLYKPTFHSTSFLFYRHCYFSL